MKKKKATRKPAAQKKSKVSRKATQHSKKVEIAEPTPKEMHSDTLPKPAHVAKNKRKSIFSFFKKKKKEERLPNLSKEIRRLHTKKKKAQKRRNLAQYWLEKAGIETEPKTVTKWMVALAGIGALILSFVVLYYLMFEFESRLLEILIFVPASLIVGFGVFMIAAWIVFYVFIDLRIYKRRTGIEEVLPDYLLLTASNIRAGMTIDRALWFAVRPRFGVLAKEMEVVAKQTASGEDLGDALHAFAEKYDSKILSRSMSLLVQSSQAGGEIGDVMEKIAKNVQQVKIMKKEMAANVMTYAIFITFAAIVAAPILFSLAGQMLIVIKKVVSQLDISDAPSGGLTMSVSEVSISNTDFLIFAITSLTITAFFSSIIVATILKGNVKEGIKYLPIFVLVSISLFLMSSAMFRVLFESLL